MGDCQDSYLRVNLDRMLTLRFLGSKGTTDAGLLAYWELDDAMRLDAGGRDGKMDGRTTLDRVRAQGIRGNLGLGPGIGPDPNPLFRL